MGVLSFLGNAVGGGGVGSIVQTVGNVIDELHTSDEEKAQAKHDLEELRQKPALMQALINMEEAKHRTFFVAGGRPFILWTCGVAFAFNFVLLPFMTFFASLAGYADKIPPPLDMATMMPVLMGILGLGGMRSFDKSKGTSK